MFQLRNVVLWMCFLPDMPLLNPANKAQIVVSPTEETTIQRQKTKLNC